jgi:LCP family protein required for cell wall assembly
VDIPGGFGKHKINSAYARAMIQKRDELQAQQVTDPKKINDDSNQAGAEELINTVQELTGQTIDNYASVNLIGFADITQAVGGVDVCLKDNVDDPYSGAKFTKGQHTISGVQALEFVRQRHGLPRGDLDRVVRQQVFMAGMAKKVLSAGTLIDTAKLDALIDAVKKSVVLNQGWDIVGFAQQMKGLTGGQLQFTTIPVENIDYRTPEDGSAIEVDPQQVHNFVQGLTSPQGVAAAPAQPPGGGNHDITVDVRNGTGRQGLAAGVEGMLTGKGFNSGEAANTTSRRTTAIRVPAGALDDGKAVATALGLSVTPSEDANVPDGHVIVYLGTDYSQATPPATQPAAGQASPSSAPSSAPDDKPITADGVTCVN